eukprot:2442358-Alexandrium_andersonii.AAC.1
MAAANVAGWSHQPHIQGQSTGATTQLPLHPAETAKEAPFSLPLVRRNADVGSTAQSAAGTGPGGSSTAGAP